jgi:hypothetical protein
MMPLTTYQIPVAEIVEELVRAMVRGFGESEAVVRQKTFVQDRADPFKRLKARSDGLAEHYMVVIGGLSRRGDEWLGWGQWYAVSCRVGIIRKVSDLPHIAGVAGLYSKAGKLADELVRTDAEGYGLRWDVPGFSHVYIRGIRGDVPEVEMWNNEGFGVVFVEMEIVLALSRR